LRVELVLQRNLRQHTGRDSDNQSHNQDSHFDFPPHRNLPPVKLLLQSAVGHNCIFGFLFLLEEAGSAA
jgi:hypothetical protein